MTLHIVGLKQVPSGVHNEMPAIHEHELRLKQGSITIIIGANGVGKTRFMETIAGLTKSEGIAVSYDSHPLWTERRSRLGRMKTERNRPAMLRYSYSCQSPEEQLFARTVRDELQYVMRPYQLDEDDRNRRASEALAAVGWDEAWLDRDPYFMSGGERRRTALACLFAPPASWLLLDEPTAGLDAAGHEQLGAQLKQQAAGGKGVLLISHESDWALQLATAVIIMHTDGRVRHCRREELLLNPHWLEDAGMDIPAWLRVAHQFACLGVPAKQVWDPAALAHEAGHIVKPNIKLLRPNTPPTVRDTRAPFALRDSDRQPSPLSLFDPRSVWITYILVSAAILFQSTWSGLGAMALVVAAAIHFGKIPLRRWRSAIMALTAFTFSVALIAGLGPQEGGGFWSTEAALVSLQSLLRPLLAMLLGFGLPLAVTPLRLRRSLEQLFSKVGKVPLWVTKLLLTITLLLRFIPVLLSEWERFARIATARGKQTERSAGGSFRRLQETSIPFMLALFRLGEQVSDALESRGVGKERQPTLLITEHWKGRDTVLAAVGSAIPVIFWMWQ
ncbi:ATP-binding cassette domain-containing protein [Paenibacillus lignilyticus]|uniref:ATP-binding cassette domain-containing protein n=1 Tax=Paenibacillus lignilyticus TaxID=1172615 RepID=A0ABS5CBE7_9BACL|nr:ATP-binding cassette domain-containing protein [Paenibacillus lignilyticus]MBP3963273.1 ATP-binding cassette domain-containing protein [Paenibacillus lignilyticus]